MVLNSSSVALGSRMEINRILVLTMTITGDGASGSYFGREVVAGYGAPEGTRKLKRFQCPDCKN